MRFRSAVQRFVPLAGGRLFEAFGAYSTCVRSLAGVSPSMGVQRRRLRKAFGADFALVRTFAGVRSLVGGKLRMARK